MEPIELRLGGNGRVLSRGVIGRTGDNQFIEYPFQLFMPDGTPQDLNGCSVIFYGTNPNGQFTSGTPEIIDSSTGKISYKFSAENFSARGEFKEAFFRVTKENGERYATQSFRLKIENDADLTQGQAQLYVSLLDEKLKDFDERFAASIEEKEQQYQTLNDKASNLETGIENSNKTLSTLEDKIDQTNQQIGDLGKLKKMYANNIDFGDYDYSGNPNLLPQLKASDFRFTNTSVTGYTKTDNGTYMKVTKAADAPSVGLITGSVTRLKSNETYTLSVDAKALTDIVAGGLTFTLRWKDSADVTRTADAFEGQAITTTETKFSKTFTTGAVSDGTAPSLQLYFNGDLVGENEIDLHYDIKLEKSSSATPYQPNLLQEPYQISRMHLGENIFPQAGLPLTTTNYDVVGKTLNKPLELGEQYVITIKATKPSTQKFTAMISGVKGLGDLTPVEGLVDTWSLTTTIPPDAPANNIIIYQMPEATKGSVTVEWVKVEKGSVRTPKINLFKYFGEGLKGSDDPTSYSWDMMPEYIMNNTVSTADPQSVGGLKNFKDGLQVDGKDVGSAIEDTGWVNLTAINGHTWDKQGQIRRIGKLVMFRGALEGSTLSTNDFCIIPEGFRPSNTTDNYEFQFLLPPKGTNIVDNGGMVYIRPNGTCGLPSFRGTVDLFLAPIQYFVD